SDTATVGQQIPSVKILTTELLPPTKERQRHVIGNHASKFMLSFPRDRIDWRRPLTLDEVNFTDSARIGSVHNFEAFPQRCLIAGVKGIVVPVDKCHEAR